MEPMGIFCSKGHVELLMHAANVMETLLFGIQVRILYKNDLEAFQNIDRG